MEIKFHSAVIIADNLDKMKQFYQDVLLQTIEVDYGNCIGFKNGLSLWKLKSEYTIAKHRGNTFDRLGNKNLEICFETDDFEQLLSNLEKFSLNYLHKVNEELWGQKTIRFYDPEDNLVEIGETMNCVVKRFLKLGMSTLEVSEKTSLPIQMVIDMCNQN